MDTKGFIKDASVKVIPSKNLKSYLSNLKYKDGMPKSIAKFNLENDTKNNLEPVDSERNKNNSASLLQTKDYERIKKLIHSEDDEVVSGVENGCNVDDIIETLTKNKDNPVKEDDQDDELSEQNNSNNEQFLCIADLEWLSLHLEEMRKDGDCNYLHELLEGSNIVLPQNETIKRNPVLEARCVKLRRDQMNRDYRAMTKGVDNVRVRQPEETIAYQIKHLNKQLIAVGQFILSIAAGFLFGFIGVELMIGRLDFGFRLLLGIMCALIIALAEIYFLAKKLNEEMNVPETIQIGGPPVFVNPNKNKPHND